MGLSNSIDDIVEREQLIVGVITDVKESKQSARRYFSTHDVPFSLRQYQTYLKAYKEKGINGLYDHREGGNARKITPEIEHYLIGLLENNRELSVSDIISQLNKRFEMDVKPRTINNFRKTHGLERIIKPVSRTEEVQFAGFEIISALAYHTGIVDAWSDEQGKIYCGLQQTQRGSHSKVRFNRRKDSAQRSVTSTVIRHTDENNHKKKSCCVILTSDNSERKHA